MKQLSSPHNPRFRAALLLKGSRGRRKAGRFLLYGIAELRRAVAAGVNLEGAFVCPESLDAAEWAEIEGWLRSAAPQLWRVPRALSQRLQYGERADGIVAIGIAHARGLEFLPAEGDRPIVVLEALEKPGNIGAILRSASAAGAEALIVADPRCDLYNPNVIRASTGCLFSLRTVVAAAADVRGWFRAREIPVFAADPQGVVEYDHVDWRRRCALVFGCESRGLSSEWRGEGCVGVRIPMARSVDSLNVSVTAAVILFEAARQRARGNAAAGGVAGGKPTRGVAGGGGDSGR